MFTHPSFRPARCRLPRSVCGRQTPGCRAKPWRCCSLGRTVPREERVFSWLFEGQPGSTGPSPGAGAGAGVSALSLRFPSPGFDRGSPGRLLWVRGF